MATDVVQFMYVIRDAMLLTESAVLITITSQTLC
jgi:hypothetical protein